MEGVQLVMGDEAGRGIWRLFLFLTFFLRVFLDINKKINFNKEKHLNKHDCCLGCLYKGPKTLMDFQEIYIVHLIVIFSLYIASLPFRNLPSRWLLDAHDFIAIEKAEGVECRLDLSGLSAFDLVFKW